MLENIKKLLEKKDKIYLLTIAFVSGFAVMNLEICASRLLAPYFGTSLFVWTNIIGVVLISLSLGYYLGGILADKSPNIKTLQSFILLGGILFLFIPWVTKPLSDLLLPNNQNIAGIGNSIFYGSLIISLILFGLPLGLLGMTSPFLIKLYAKEQNIGKGSGLIFAISTFGSILGTFLPTLFLIPFFGTKKAVLIGAAALIIISLPVLKFKPLRFLIIVFLILGLVSPYITPIKEKLTLEEKESVHQYIQVSQNKSGARFMSFDEGLGVQSILPAEGYITGTYYDYYSSLPILTGKHDQIKVLLIGLAGGTIIRQLNHFYGSSVNITAIELDNEAIKLANKWFDIKDIPATIYNMDGLVFLKNNTEKYDIIIIDAYQNELRIPWTLTTIEFWQKVDLALNKGGIAGMNINSKTAKSPLFASITKTQQQVFPNVYATKISDSYITNFMVTLAKENLDFQKIAAQITNPELFSIKERLALTTLLAQQEEGQILTDDKAPIEFLTDTMLYSLGN